MPDISLHLDGVSVASSAAIKNLGVIFDPELSFLYELQNTYRITFFHLRNITKIRKMLSVHDAEKLVHAFVTSRLDHCNVTIFRTEPEPQLGLLSYSFGFCYLYEIFIRLILNKNWQRLL